MGGWNGKENLHQQEEDSNANGEGFRISGGGLQRQMRQKVSVRSGLIQESMLDVDRKTRR